MVARLETVARYVLALLTGVEESFSTVVQPHAEFAMATCLRLRDHLPDDGVNRLDFVRDMLNVGISTNRSNQILDVRYQQCRLVFQI